MDPQSHPPPPPPPGAGRPPLGRIPSWQRVSPVSPGGAVIPPPPPPPTSGSQFGSDFAATSPRSSRSSFVLDGGSSEPRPGMGQISPEILDEMRKFMEAGGYEGMKKRIVEEVGKHLKNSDSDRDSMASRPGPPPPPTPSFPGQPPVLRPGSQIPPQHSGPSLPHTPPASPHHKPQAYPPSSKISPSSGPPPPLARPRQPGREASLSAVDKSWGELFDANGRATKRFGQVLRGLASYLILQASPLESVVITPSKLSAFYKRFTFDNEPHPYSEVFECHEEDKKDYKDIANLYEELECDYHLVKPHSTSHMRPLVPALTPAGFVKWTITTIYAYPDDEATRLDAVMSRLPIDVECDGKHERLPKQLSRHLLPPKADKTARRVLVEAVEEVLFQRGVREKKMRRASYGSGGVRSRPMSKRSESEPMPRTTDYRRPSRDSDEEQPKKHVSFGRPRAPDANGPAQSRRPSSERGGKAYNPHNGKTPTPASSERHDEPISPASSVPSPSSTHFEVSSGRDREKEYRYSRAAAPRRMSSDKERSGSRGRKERKPEVVVKQDRGSSSLRQVLDDLGLFDVL